MNTYIVLFMAPAAVIAEWMQKDPAEREAADTKMRSDWDAWMREHASSIKQTMAGGATKRVTSEGTADVKNDIMLYSIIEAPSHEEAAKLFEHHPHLGIPQASIEIMAIRPM